MWAAGVPDASFGAPMRATGDLETGSGLQSGKGISWRILSRQDLTSPGVLLDCIATGGKGRARIRSPQGGHVMKYVTETVTILFSSR